jgi:hypothetical protein
MTSVRAGNGAAELAAAGQDAGRERVKVAPAVLEARELAETDFLGGDRGVDFPGRTLASW